MRMREGCILLINIKYSFVIEEKEKENLSKKKRKNVVVIMEKSLID